MGVATAASLAPEYARLSAYLTACRAWVLVAPLSTAQRNAADTNLNTAAHWLARLGPTGDLGMSVAAGTFEVRRWVALANEQGNAIETAWRAASPLADFSRVWDEIIVPTAQDTADAAKTAVAVGVPTLLLVLVAYVLLTTRGR